MPLSSAKKSKSSIKSRLSSNETPKTKIRKDMSEYKKIKAFIREKYDHNEEITDVPKQREIHDLLFGSNSPYDHPAISNHCNSIKKKLVSGTLSDGESQTFHLTCPQNLF
jgi:hypothetical protein